MRGNSEAKREKSNTLQAIYTLFAAMRNGLSKRGSELGFAGTLLRARAA